jgi:hypothetical protein
VAALAQALPADAQATFDVQDGMRSYVNSFKQGCLLPYVMQSIDAYVV